MKYRISAVSYLNTLPFLYGITQSDFIKERALFSVDYPSRVAEKLLSNQADIGLVPVVVLKDNPQLQIVCDYGIIADGPVASVKLFSSKPIENVQEILLDYQSRTSVNLIKVLARFHWGISPRWIEASEGFEYKMSNGSSALIIGDRALQLLGKTKFEYDLAEEWKKMTGLPFVFAAWVANKPIDRDFLRAFEQAIQQGIEDISKVTEYYAERMQKIKDFFDPYVYLSQYIKYKLSEEAKISIERFFHFLEQI